MNAAGDRKVVVLGASDNPERYAYKAFSRLREKGYDTIPVNPSLGELEGQPVLADLSSVEPGPDTLTVYLSPKRSSPLADKILALRPKRVILNPGAENEELQKALDDADIPWMHACTLVLLSTGRF